MWDPEQQEHAHKTASPNQGPAIDQSKLAANQEMEQQRHDGLDSPKTAPRPTARKERLQPDPAAAIQLLWLGARVHEALEAEEQSTQPTKQKHLGLAAKVQEPL
jgi:hypothetical protein